MFGSSHEASMNRFLYLDLSTGGVSAKSHSDITPQVSLNDIMMVRPINQNELLIILRRFRCHRYELTTDIV